MLGKDSRQFYFHFDMLTEDIAMAAKYMEAKGHQYEMQSFSQLSEANEGIVPTEETVRIYINAHGGKAKPQYIRGGKKQEMTVQELVALLKPKLENLTKENYLQCNPHPLLSLNICYAAGNDPDLLNTFAGQLHRELAENGIYVNINARNITLILAGDAKYTIREEDKPKYKELLKKAKEVDKSNFETFVQIREQIRSLARHQDPGSKFTFAWAKDGDQLRQVAVESYWLKERQAHLDKIILLNKSWDDLIENMLDDKTISGEERKKIREKSLRLKNKLFIYAETLNQMIKLDENDFLKLHENIKTTLSETREMLKQSGNSSFFSFFSSGSVTKLVKLADDINKELDQIKPEPEFKKPGLV